MAELPSFIVAINYCPCGQSGRLLARYGFLGWMKVCPCFGYTLSDDGGDVIAAELPEIEVAPRRHLAVIQGGKSNVKAA